jgi:succinoglycan biosynthesis transport protein ExoP
VELAEYLGLLRRRFLFVLIPLVLVPVLAYAWSARQTNEYLATAQVLLKPNNPNEGLNTAGGQQNDLSDADRYVAGQIAVVESRELAAQVAKSTGLDAVALRGGVSASQRGASNVIEISYKSPDPASAATLANAIAAGYIENRRLDQVAGLQRASAELQKTLDDLEAQVKLLSSQSSAPGLSAADKAVLATQLDASTTRFQTLFDRQQELTVDIALKQGAAELVQSAAAPTVPVSPRPMRTAVLGGFLGLLLGVGAALAAEQLDDRLRSRSDIEEFLGVGVIGEIPADRGSKGNATQIAASANPNGALAEAARQLRTTVQFMAIERPIRRLLITSAVPAEGKTVVTANLAVAFAQAGQRVIVVSADLRKPRIDEMFGVSEPTRGLSDLIGLATIAANRLSVVVQPDAPVDTALAELINAELDGGMLRFAVPNLALLSAGSLPHNPAEILGSPVARLVLDVLESRCDLMIFDSPPVLAVADARILANEVDSAIIVAAANQTSRHRLERACQATQASRARLLGIVVNKVAAEASYTYGYGYRGPAPSGKRQNGVVELRDEEAAARRF